MKRLNSAHVRQAQRFARIRVWSGACPLCESPLTSEGDCRRCAYRAVVGLDASWPVEDRTEAEEDRHAEFAQDAGGWEYDESEKGC